MNDNPEDKIDKLFNHLIDRMVDEVYIEDDAFCIIFDDGTFLQLYSEDGDLDLYFEMPQEEPKLH